MNTFFIILFFSSLVLSQKIIISDSLLTDTPLKNPSKAYLWSMLIPGAGQIYNEDYWKTALIVPTFSYLLYRVINKNKRINFLRSRIHSTEAQISTMNKMEDEEQLGDLNVQLNRDKNEVTNVTDERNVAIWSTGLVYLINVLDAYISAYLFGFDEIMDYDENRRLKVNSTFVENKFEVQFQFNF